jgi:hypothetical protein
MKNYVFWDIMPYSMLKVHRRFRGIGRHHFQSRIISFLSISWRFTLGLLFDTEVEASYSSERSFNFRRTTRRYIPEDRNLWEPQILITGNTWQRVRTQICFQTSKWFRIHRRTESQDSAVSIETGHGLDDRGVGVRVPLCEEFSFLHVVKTGSGDTQFPIQWIPKAISPGVKRPEREADHSPPVSA